MAAAGSRIVGSVQEALWRDHELSTASGDGRCSDGPPGPNASMMIMRPPQRGHGSARTRNSSAVPLASVVVLDTAPANISRMRAMLSARLRRRELGVPQPFLHKIEGDASGDRLHPETVAERPRRSLL